MDLYWVVSADWVNCEADLVSRGHGLNVQPRIWKKVPMTDVILLKRSPYTDVVGGPIYESCFLGFQYFSTSRRRTRLNGSYSYPVIIESGCWIIDDENRTTLDEILTEPGYSGRVASSSTHILGNKKRFTPDLYSTRKIKRVKEWTKKNVYFWGI